MSNGYRISTIPATISAVKISPDNNAADSASMTMLRTAHLNTPCYVPLLTPSVCLYVCAQRACVGVVAVWGRGGSKLASERTGVSQLSLVISSTKIWHRNAPLKHSWHGQTRETNKIWRSRHEFIVEWLSKRATEFENLYSALIMQPFHFRNLFDIFHFQNV